jgi:hypothetical protein
MFCQKLSKCYIATSFDLWLFRGAHDIFILVINLKGLIGSQSMLTIGLFKATKVISQALRRHLMQVLNESYILIHLVCQSVCRGPETQITFNKTVPPNSRAQKLFRTSSSYFLLLLLRPFPRSNCRRSLLLTFTFTSVFA